MVWLELFVVYYGFRDIFFSISLRSIITFRQVHDFSVTGVRAGDTTFFSSLTLYFYTHHKSLKSDTALILYIKKNQKISCIVCTPYFDLRTQNQTVYINGQLTLKAGLTISDPAIAQQYNLGYL